MRNVYEETCTLLFRGRNRKVDLLKLMAANVDDELKTTRVAKGSSVYIRSLSRIFACQ